jgi:uncharacterized heparinase superfamily protein
MAPSQIAWRIRYLILQRWWRCQKRSLPLCHPAEILQECKLIFGNIPQIDSVKRIIERAEAICQGQFSFLNQSMHFDGGLPDWSASPDGDRLWNYTLHYFEYGYDLLGAYKVTKQSQYLECLIELINDWIDRNLFWKPIPWNPYPLSKRLIVWTTLLGHLKDDLAFPDQGLERMLVSICQHADFLAHNLEYDIGNNHLITNARALLWVGIHLGGHPQARKWLDKGLSLLKREISKQILTDGGHYERSSSYHLVVLQELLETALLMQQADLPVPNFLEQAISRMYDFLAAILKPDGSLPMLNDTVIGYPVPVADILAVGAVYLKRSKLKGLVRGEPGEYLDWVLGASGRQAFNAISGHPSVLGSIDLAQSGYYVLRSGEHKDGEYLIFDCGPIGPRHSPGHGHADTLSFELAAYGQTLIVDPGVYEYMESEWRDYFRSTAAHNTVTVDEQDQSVFWSSFRVAEMAQARLVRWETREAYDDVEGEHDGYVRLRSPVIHRRRIQYLKPDRWIITDVLESDGRAAHRYDLWFHLTPCRCSLDTNTCSYRALFADGIVLGICPEHPEGTEPEIQEGWISYTWKQKTSAPVVRYSLASSEPVTIFRTMLTVSLTQG